MDHPENERRRMRVLLAAAGLACLVLVAGLVPSPFAIERPGPAVDVFGSVEIDGKTQPVLRVEGGRDVSGELRLLTVSTSGDPEHPASWLELVPTIVDPSQDAVPIAELYPSGITEKQLESRNDELMRSSQAQARIAAARALGEAVEVELVVAEVPEGSAAAGLLEEGDRILSVGGSAVEDFADLRARIAESGAGRPLAIEVDRGGGARTVEVTPLPSDDGPLLGVTIATRYDSEVDASFALDRIGGPSAGLVFALGIYAELAPEDPIAGQRVSGTGTIDADGAVGAIGGLTQKMWAASRAGGGVFLMPRENCAELPAVIPPGLEIAPVGTLDEAISALEAAADGTPPSGIAACRAGGAGS